MKNMGESPPYFIRVIISKVLFLCNIFLLIFFIIFPREVLSAAREGLMLWFNNVLPALLPFIVVVNIMVSFGFVRIVSNMVRPFMRFVFRLPGAGGFAFITGLISGYPMGAKTVADLCNSGEITVKDAQRLLAFCNNAGPLFIIGVVGVGLLKDSVAGYILWGGHILAALIIGVYMRRYGDEEGYHKTNIHYTKNRTFGLGKVLGESVRNAMEALVLVGGLIIFFSVITRVIMVVFDDLPFIGAIAGALEVTGGVKILADTAESPVSPLRMAAIGGLIGFGGFSVHAQALHFTSGIGIKSGMYLLYKAIGGVIAAGITFVLWLLIQNYIA